MRRIAVINQKGGVGKTTTSANLGAALAIQGRRVVVVDMDAQANLSLSLGVEAPSDAPTSYSILTGALSFGECTRATNVPGLRLVPSNLDLSGAELELASAMGREYLLRDALREWESAQRAARGPDGGRAPADYVLFDCPPSLGLLSINALAASGEVLITLQTEFLALQGMSKLVGVVQLLKKRLNPDLVITGILPCLYDSRLKLAREVLGEIRAYFKSQVFPHPIRSNVKLAEAPSFGKTIFEYAPESHGAVDYMWLAREIMARESSDADLRGLPPFDEKAKLAVAATKPPRVIVPPPRRPPEAKPTIIDSAKATVIGPAKPSAGAPAKPTAAKPMNPTAPQPLATTHAKPSAKPEATPAPNRPATPTVTQTATSIAPSTAKPTPKQRATATVTPEAKLNSRPDANPTSPSEVKPAATLGTKSRGASNSMPAAKIPSSAVPPTARREEPAGADAKAKKPRETRTSASQEKPASPIAVPPTIPTSARSARRAGRAGRAEDMPQLPPDAFEILNKNLP